MEKRTFLVKKKDIPEDWLIPEEKNLDSDSFFTITMKETPKTWVEHEELLSAECKAKRREFLGECLNKDVLAPYHDKIRVIRESNHIIEASVILLIGDHDVPEATATWTMGSPFNLTYVIDFYGQERAVKFCESLGFQVVHCDEIPSYFQY